MLSRQLQLIQRLTWEVHDTPGLLTLQATEPGNTAIHSSLGWDRMEPPLEQIQTLRLCPQPASVSPIPLCTPSVCKAYPWFHHGVLWRRTRVPGSRIMGGDEDTNSFAACIPSKTLLRPGGGGSSWISRSDHHLLLKCWFQAITGHTSGLM